MNIGTYFGYNNHIDYKHAHTKKGTPHEKRHSLATVQMEFALPEYRPSLHEPQSLKCPNQH